MRVRERIARAAERAGRHAEDVTLIAVSKTVDSATAQHAVDAGAHDLGENRVQEAITKVRTINGDIRWHLIGHLQRNKIERTLPLVERIHAVDSLRLLQAIDQESAQQQCRPRILLEVNASGEATKQGFAAAELLEETGG